MLLIPISASAASARTQQAILRLTFDDTQANCSVLITGNYATDLIFVTMELKQGSKTIDTWSSSEYGILSLVETAPAEEN